MIKFLRDNSGTLDQFTIILSTRDYRHLGQLANVSEVKYTAHLNAANELSFVVTKTLDEHTEVLWDKIIDFKLAYVQELNEYFEITVSLVDQFYSTKTITATSLCEAELSQTYLRDIEINTEDDIARDDYDANYPTIFYRDVDSVVDESIKRKLRNSSLLHRIIDKVPSYSIKHVDSSLINLLGTFSISETTLYDFMIGDCANQFDCIFQFDSTDRSISVYDLKSVCQNNKCGYYKTYHKRYRGDFADICPKCGSSNIKYYGKDTTVFVSTENLTDQVQFDTDTGSVKNCFQVVAGDDLMTAMVRQCNPSNSSYIYEFNDDTLNDMPEGLQTGWLNYKNYLDEVNTVDFYLDAADLDIPDGTTPIISSVKTDIYEKYNALCEKYNDYDMYLEATYTCSQCGYSTTGNGYSTTCPVCKNATFARSDRWNLIPDNSRNTKTVAGYQSIVPYFYDTVDFASYLGHSMMPNVVHEDPTLSGQIDSINKNLTEVVVATLNSATSKNTVDNTVLSNAKFWVNTGFVKVEISDSTWDYSTAAWSGTILLTQIDDDTKTASVTKSFTVLNGKTEVEKYLKQKISIKLSEDTNDEYSVVGVVNKDINSDPTSTDYTKGFNYALKKYCTSRLGSFYGAIETVLGVLVEEGQSDGSTFDATAYEDYEANKKFIDATQNLYDTLPKLYSKFESIKTKMLKIDTKGYRSSTDLSAVRANFRSAIASYLTSKGFKSSDYILDGKDYNTLAKSISSLSSVVTPLQNDYDNLTTSYKSKKNEYTSYKTQSTTLSKQIKELQKELNLLYSKATTDKPLTEEINKVKNDIQTTKESKTSVDNKIDTLKDEIASLKESMEKTSEELSPKAKLLSQFEKYNREFTAVNTVEKLIASCKSKYTELYDTLKSNITVTKGDKTTITIQPFSKKYGTDFNITNLVDGNFLSILNDYVNDVKTKVDSAKNENAQHTTAAALYEDFYVPYYNKLAICQTEMDLRANEVNTITGTYKDGAEWNNSLSTIAKNVETYGAKMLLGEWIYFISSSLNLKDYLDAIDTDYYKVLMTYIREQTYKNENYISTGIESDNRALFENAQECIKKAKEELHKSATYQHSISSNINNLLMIDEFSPILDNFELGNWIRVKVDDTIVRLRLITYSADIDSATSLETEFSDVTITATGLNDIQSILSQASSMASTYDYITDQAEEVSTIEDNYIDQWVTKGLDSSLIRINSNDKEELTIDSNGLTAKTYDDILDEYSPEQLRITHNVLAFTDDNWQSVKTALGKFTFSHHRPLDTGNTSTYVEEKYGLVAEAVLAGWVVGSHMEASDIIASHLQNIGNTNYVDLYDYDPNDTTKSQSYKEYFLKCGDKFSVDKSGNLYTYGGILSGSAGHINLSNDYTTYKYLLNLGNGKVTIDSSGNLYSKGGILTGDAGYLNLSNDYTGRNYIFRVGEIDGKYSLAIDKNGNLTSAGGKFQTSDGTKYLNLNPPEDGYYFYTPKFNIKYDGTVSVDGIIHATSLTIGTSNKTVEQLADGEIAAASISANQIKTGTLTVGGSASGTNTNGSIVVKDSSNNAIFSASKSGVSVKGTIYATTLYVGTDSKSADEWAKGIADGCITADKIKSLNLEVGNQISMGSNATIKWANVTNHPTKVSQFTNDSGFVDEDAATEITENTVTTGYVNALNVTAKTFSAETVKSKKFTDPDGNNYLNLTGSGSYYLYIDIGNSYKTYIDSVGRLCSTRLIVGASEDTKIPFVRFDTNAISLNYAGSGLTTGGINWTQLYKAVVSDYRLKNSINDINLDFSKKIIDAFNPKTYKFNGSDRISYGFIAQDFISSLKKYDIDIDDNSNDLAYLEFDDYYHVNYNQFIPHIINVIKDQANEIQILKDQLNELKEKING